MEREFFAKVSKTGDVLIIRIPNKERRGFKTGDPVFVRKITSVEEKYAK